ncbi:uncharacterized protein CLUP02_01626 [Colletotrichum lupini]|uniref:Uncharacterized protein n=1 Tax=Colletotrichum lupini TaxID=145971 RepID=A0A9Q8SDB9_9PEZI|nr:uncharacterized protein CLUP02_01626 [Colletotrichum lupini]UQC74973.1 hypothetical protein CLUP02_01626 [Colletotrichum lupini]
MIWAYVGLEFVWREKAEAQQLIRLPVSRSFSGVSIVVDRSDPSEKPLTSSLPASNEPLICNGAIRRQAAEREDPVALCATVQGGAEKGDDVFALAREPRILFRFDFTRSDLSVMLTVDIETEHCLWEDGPMLVTPMNLTEISNEPGKFIESESRKMQAVQDPKQSITSMELPTEKTDELASPEAVPAAHSKHIAGLSRGISILMFTCVNV